MSTVSGLHRRLRRLERGGGLSPLCPLCRGEGDFRIVLVYAALDIVERRGCERCGKTRSVRREAIGTGGGSWR
ncbi:MAG: hypothetical protein IT429_15225 [Gemmataceae bacterium]|nr:hypothetical protein [Gemmataceae bacterium]